MGEAEPVGEEARGLFGGRAVERHERARHADGAPQLSPPLCANWRDFNLIRAAADVLFEVVNVHVG